MEHRIGGLEKEDGTGNVSYDPENHQRMVQLRAEKIERVGKFVEEPEIDGPDEGDVLIIGWGSTYGTIITAVQELRRQGVDVAHFHLRWLNPLPQNLNYYIRNFRHVIVPEVNTGQLAKVLRAKYLVDVKSFSRVKGQPLMVQELIQAVKNILARE